MIGDVLNRFRRGGLRRFARSTGGPHETVSSPSTTGDEYRRDIDSPEAPTPMGASITDDGSYPEFCQSAALDPSIFATFRSNPIYTEVLEHVSAAQGHEYLKQIRNDPERC